MTSLEATDPNEIFSAEIQQIIQNTLSSLPQRTREIFMMSRFGNKPHKEVAERFNISIKGVDYHIARSVKDLRVALQDYLPLLSALTFLN
jgi:RNA polymerase sigma-70 factor (ECF subfamily)